MVKINLSKLEKISTGLEENAMGIDKGGFIARN